MKSKPPPPDKIKSRPPRGKKVELPPKTEKPQVRRAPR